MIIYSAESDGIGVKIKGWNGVGALPRVPCMPGNVKRDKKIFRKLIKSGDVYEFYEYEKGVRSDFSATIFDPETGEIFYEREKPISRYDIAKRADDDLDEFFDLAHKIRQRFKSGERAGAEIRRLINANVGQWGNYPPVFFTITFRECIKNIKLANYEWKLFMQRLKYYLETHLGRTEELKYLTVVEFQDGDRLTTYQRKTGRKGRGAIHYHAVFFNLPFIAVDKAFYEKRGRCPRPGEKFLTDFWTNGSIDIAEVRDRNGEKLRVDSVDNIGAYISAYLTSDPTDDRFDGEKKYFCSKKLNRYEEITDRGQIEAALVSLSARKPTFERAYENEYIGKISYREFNLRRVAG